MSKGWKIATGISVVLAILLVGAIGFFVYIFFIVDSDGNNFTVTIENTSKTVTHDVKLWYSLGNDTLNLTLKPGQTKKVRINHMGDSGIQVEVAATGDEHVLTGYASGFESGKIKIVLDSIGFKSSKSEVTTGILSIGKDVSVCDRTSCLTNSKHEELRQEDLDVLADQLCDEDKALLLADNKNKEEFFGRMIGEKQMKQMGFSSMKDYVSKHLKVTEHLPNNRKWTFKSCESIAKSISCDDAVERIEEGGYNRYLGLTDEVLEDRIRFAMNSMKIETCASIDSRFMLNVENEMRHNIYFVSDFGDGPTVFYTRHLEMPAPQQ